MLCYVTLLSNAGISGCYAKFRDWLLENHLEYDWAHCDLKSQDQEMIDFKLYLTDKYYSQMYQHLRDIGVKIPITGTNWICRGYDFHASHKNMDFMDTHPYVTNWKWDTDRTFLDTSITSMTNPRNISSRMCVAGKPFFLSEWDMPWPNPYRAESAIFYAAVACLHNWSGLAVHTYAYSTRVDKHDPLGRETTTCIGNSLSREGIFTVWNDWARFGLFYHAALMVRRRDVRPSDRKVAISAADMRQHSNRAFGDSLELFKTAFTLEENVPEGYEERILDTDAVSSPNPQMRVSCTGQMRRHLTKQVGIVDSERTKIVYGTLTNAAGPDLAINDMEIHAATDFGVIALSSLTDDAITDSENMLLSAIGQVRNTGQIFDGNHLAELGTTPIVAELIQADIHIKNRFGERIVVWGINAEGTYVKRMPTTCKDGWISFTIGVPMAPACYYLIFKE